jgi:hypothetical protein
MERSPAVRFTLVYAEPGADFAGDVLYLGGEVFEFGALEIHQVLGPEEV